MENLLSLVVEAVEEMGRGEEEGEEEGVEEEGVDMGGEIRNIMLLRLIHRMIPNSPLWLKGRGVLELGSGGLLFLWPSKWKSRNSFGLLHVAWVFGG